MISFQRKSLTADQFKRANRLTAGSMSLVYGIFLVLNFTSGNIHSWVNKFIFAAIYIVWYAITAFVVKKNVTKRSAMLMLAIGFELSYVLLVLTTHSVSMLLIFPVLITITVYHNEVLFLWGAIGSLVIMLMKSTIIRFNGTGTAFDFKVINIALFGEMICVVGGFLAIRLLIKFSREETEAVAELLSNQRYLARQVNDVAEEVSAEFVEVLSDLKQINETVNTTSEAMSSIAEGSEETADSASKQSMMTNEIQSRLESTNQTALHAKQTTDELKNAIEIGRQQSDELEKQSHIVDHYTANISDSINELVERVGKVSEITDMILNISSQTNLLALNASIEAARAGEAGRGFAVVADEIRKLAEETKKSTEMITGIMNELHAVTDQAQEALNGSVKSIGQQREQIKKVNESFQTVDEGIVVLSDGVNSMNDEVVAVLEANHNIVMSIDTLAAISQEMSSNSTQSASDMSVLADSMNKFTEVIKQTSVKLDELKEKASV